MAVQLPGLISFTESSAGGQIPVLVVPSLAAPATIPLALWPDFVNDAGVPAFGGARYISVFDYGNTEGAATLVTPITQQSLDVFGGIIVPNPDPAQTYKVMIRLRSEVGDANFVDRICEFRVVTPLMVPFAVSRYTALQQPNLVWNDVAGSFQFAPIGGFTTMPTGEIRLHTATGGIVLPNATGVSFSDEANDYLLDLFQRVKRGPVVVDFAADGTTESHMRITYWVTSDPSTPLLPYTIVQYRRQDFAAWGEFTGTEVNFASATVDIAAEQATLTFVRGLYALGPRFQSIWIAGQKGSMTINPNALVAGATIDISEVVDFTAKSHLTAHGLADKFLLLFCTTSTRTLGIELPLRPQGQFDYVTQDGVTNVFSGFTGATIPVSPLFFRPLLEEYLEVPNLTVYYDPAAGLLPDAVTLPYPRIENIEIFEEDNVTASVTYTDTVDLYNQMFTIRMPEIGISRNILDLRELRRDGGLFTAISKTAAYVRVVMEINQDGTALNRRTVEAWYKLNPDGQPEVWKLDTTALPVGTFDRPLLTFDPVAFELTIEFPNPTNINFAQVALRGDIGETTNLQGTLGVSFAAGGSYTVPKAVMELLTTSIAEMVEVQFVVASGTYTGTFRVRHSLHRNDELVVGVAGNEIAGFFTGHSVVFTDLSAVLVTSGRKEVMLLGDGPPLIIRDAIEGQPTFFNLQGVSTLGSRLRQPWIDVVYMVDIGGTPTQHRWRMYNSFFDARSAAPRAFSITPTVPWGGSAGTDYQGINFSPPNMLFDLTNATVVFENDFRTYNFSWWAFFNLKNTRKAQFLEQLEVSAKYQLGSVLQGVAVGEQLLFVARHRNGTERAFIVDVRTDQFMAPRPATVQFSQ